MDTDPIISKTVSVCHDALSKLHTFCFDHLTQNVTHFTIPIIQHQNLQSYITFLSASIAPPLFSKIYFNFIMNS